MQKTNLSIIALSLVTFLHSTVWGAWPLTDFEVGGDDLLVNRIGISVGDDGICASRDFKDGQRIDFGKGEPNSVCIKVGPNGVLDTPAPNDPNNDDRVGTDELGKPCVTSGNDGIRQTDAQGDDEEIFAKGQGLPGVLCIEADVNGMIGRHIWPQGVVTTFGEYAVSANGLHEGIDIPGTADVSHCIALVEGSLNYDERVTDGPDVITNSAVQLSPVGGPTYQYLHTHWNYINDGERPSGTVPANTVISRVLPFSNTFPHVHLGVQEGGGYSNPLRAPALTPTLTYDTGYPKFVLNQKGQPNIRIMPDGTGNGFRVRTIPGNPPMQRVVVNTNADIIAQVESRSWNFYTNKPNPMSLNLSEHLPTLPYEAKVSITSLDGYVFARTLFRMDSIPGDWDAQAEKSLLLFARGYQGVSQPYKRFDLILTNCDGSENFGNLANVTESNWPVGEKDDQGEWLVPNGRYTITVTVKDYAGAEATSSINVEVDHGDFQRPTNTQN